jgi:hypothetical protein
MNKKLLSIAIALAALLSLTAGGGLVNAVSPTVVSAYPTAISGYLPINGYANGRGWGSIYTDGDVGTGNALKFISGYEGVGVSCGVLGGYVQFDMGLETPITNNPNNEYGVDFVVYGNVLSSSENPEPGVVVVSSDGTNWYELAGSLYYDASTLHGENITYINVTTPDTTFNRAGIWHSFDYTGSVPTATWTFLTGSTAWWPAYKTSNTPPAPYYSRVYDIDCNVNIQGGGGYITWNRTAPYEIITYKDITVLDNETSKDDLRFGYFDVTPNGKNYGVPENPYVPYGTRVDGGDGYDLSWAVDPNGNPVALASVRFVRLYSATNLYRSADNSAEVCGLYTVNGGGRGTAVAPTITIDGYTLDYLKDEYDISYTITSVSDNQQILTITNLREYPSLSFSLGATGGTYVYMNSSFGSSYAVDVSSGTIFVRVVNQSDDAEAFVTLIQLSE